MITYKPLWKTMKTKGITTYAMIHKLNIANGTLYRIRQGKPITTETINQLCIALECDVEDIIQYIKDK